MYDYVCTRLLIWSFSFTDHDAIPNTNHAFTVRILPNQTLTRALSSNVCSKSVQKIDLLLQKWTTHHKPDMLQLVKFGLQLFSANQIYSDWLVLEKNPEAISWKIKEYIDLWFKASVCHSSGCICPALCCLHTVWPLTLSFCNQILTIKERSHSAWWALTAFMDADFLNCKMFRLIKFEHSCGIFSSLSRDDTCVPYLSVLGEKLPIDVVFLEHGDTPLSYQAHRLWTDPCHKIF